MKKLGFYNYTMISEGVKTIGTFNPEKIFFIFEEDLYVNESDTIYAFLNWCHQNNRTFGSGNYEEMFQKFLNVNK